MRGDKRLLRLRSRRSRESPTDVIDVPTPPLDGAFALPASIGKPTAAASISDRVEGWEQEQRRPLPGKEYLPPISRVEIYDAQFIQLAKLGGHENDDCFTPPKLRQSRPAAPAAAPEDEGTAPAPMDAKAHTSGTTHLPLPDRAEAPASTSTREHTLRNRWTHELEAAFGDDDASTEPDEGRARSTTTARRTVVSCPSPASNSHWALAGGAILLLVLVAVAAARPPYHANVVLVPSAMKSSSAKAAVTDGSAMAATQPRRLRIGPLALARPAATVLAAALPAAAWLLPTSAAQSIVLEALVVAARGAWSALGKGGRAGWLAAFGLRGGGRGVAAAASAAAKRGGSGGGRAIVPLLCGAPLALLKVLEAAGAGGGAASTAAATVVEAASAAGAASRTASMAAVTARRVASEIRKVPQVVVQWTARNGATKTATFTMVGHGLLHLLG